MPEQTLNQELKGHHKSSGPDFFRKRLTPEIANNLHHALRDYQKEALGRFDFYMTDYFPQQKPVQLLFHMATGSGKTLVMAGCMLWLYKQGYRNFIFFVPTNNIIQKTKDNFLIEQHSNKYLFTESIEIEGKTVQVNEVQNFAEANEDDINIVFTTTGGLHMKLNKPRENSMTYEDFEDKKVVLLSDETHHTNALTRANPSQQELEYKSTWEQTIKRIHETSDENVLLEFTATMDLENEQIFKKYKDKLLYQYSLKQFRRDGYSKEIYMTKSSAEPLQRALLALILSQYRRKVAEEHKIALRPVVLFKSIYIKNSKKLKESFDEMIEHLSEDDIKQVEQQLDEQSPDLKKAFAFFRAHDISYSDLTEELKIAFDSRKDRCIIIDSKSITEEKQKKLNSLEDHDNEVRAIFAVKQLDEGWDVLNLFDIVKMNDSFTPNTTLQERQLIGRGARYYPFGDKNSEMYFKRKFDEASGEEKELRIIEKLNYHCQREVAYINRLRKGLQDDGIYPRRRSKREIELKLKDEVRKGDFYRKGVVYVNKRESREEKNLKVLAGTQVKDTYPHELPRRGIDEDEMFEDDEPNRGVPVREVTYKNISLSNMDSNLIRAAIDRYDIFKFSSLKKLFPALSSMNEFINSDDYLAGIIINISGGEDQLDNLNRQQYFTTLIAIAGELKKDIGRVKSTHTGSPKFYSVPLREKVQNKPLSITLTEASDQERGIGMRDTDKEHLRFDVGERDWYMFEENYGTSEEKSLIKFMDKAMEELSNNYSDIYLLRNEEFYTFYDFAEGRGFRPDFLLFMKNEESEANFQIFIESKGEVWREADDWKNKFLKEIEERYELKTLYNDGDYRLIGMPFYTEEMNDEFEEKWIELND